MPSEAMKCHLVAFLGPRGLTRMALRFQEPSSASCAMELTSACNVHQDVQEMKDGRPDVETQHICWGSNSLFTWRSLMTGCSSMIFSLQPRKLLIHDLFTFRRFVGIVAHAVYMCMYIYIYVEYWYAPCFDGCADFDYHSRWFHLIPLTLKDHLESVEFELDIGPCFVEYAAEKRGYTVTVGYVVWAVGSHTTS